MNPARSVMAAASLVLLCSSVPTRAAEPGSIPKPPAIEGTYRDQGGTATLVVQRLSGDFLYLSCTLGWEGMGLLQGTRYEGNFREQAARGSGAQGHQVIDWREDGGLDIRTSHPGSDGTTLQRWQRVGAVPFSLRLPTLVKPEDLEGLPLALDRRPPIYPEAARRAGIQGTVLVKAHVREDGAVDSVQVARSIPLLDGAAMAAVRQWRFEPARLKGKAVAVWAVVPVKFSLH